MCAPPVFVVARWHTQGPPYPMDSRSNQTIRIDTDYIKITEGILPR